METTVASDAVPDAIISSLFRISLLKAQSSNTCRAFIVGAECLKNPSAQRAYDLKMKLSGVRSLERALLQMLAMETDPHLNGQALHVQQGEE